MEKDNVEYRIIVSDKAASMLILHAGFLANVNEALANRFILEFEEKANSLSQFPQRCSWLESDYLPNHKYRKLVLGKWYLIIFQIKDNHVYIDYVLDCRKDYSWLIE